MIIGIKDMDIRNVILRLVFLSLTIALRVCLALTYFFLASTHRDGKYSKSYRAIPSQIELYWLVLTLGQLSASTLIRLGESPKSHIMPEIQDRFCFVFKSYSHAIILRQHYHFCS